MGAYGSVTFEVWGDSSKLFDSGIRTGADAALAVSVDATGQKELRLVVTDAGDTASSDHADWANARITCSNTGDITPPTVVSRTPAVNATNVAVTSSIQATFSEAIDPATVTVAAFQVIPDGDSRSIAGVLSYDNTTRIVTLVPSPPLNNSTKYNVVLKAASGVTDLAGNPLETDVNWSFTTSASGPNYQYLSDMQWSSMTNGWGPAELDRSNGDNAIGDGVGLKIENVPYAKGIGVHAQSTIRYTLGGACTTFLADIGVDDEVGPNGSVNFQVWADGSQLFTSSVKTGTMPAQSITVDITGRQELTLIVDGGADINSDHADWGNAKVACTGANTKPTAVIATPASTLKYKVGDVINFSGSATDEQDGNLPASVLNWTIIIHHCPGGSCHTHPFLSYTGAGSSFVVPDHGDDSYFEIQLTAKDTGGLTDSKSITLQPQTVQVTLNTQPTGLQVGYGELTGTAPMVRNSIVGSKQSIYVTTPQGGYRFLSWSDNGAIQHTVSVGTTPATYTATFTNDSTPPTITAFSPAANASGVAANTAVSATFSEAMQASTVNANTFLLVRQGTSVPVAASIAYTSTSRTATLQPSAALTSGAVYTATVKSGATGVKDIAGNALAADISWSFTIAAASGDTVPPTITSRAPAAGATNVSTTSSVTATFSEPMNASTLNANTVTLVRQGTTTLIAGTVTYNSTTRIVTLKPSAALAASSQYTATVVGGAGGVKDVAGNPLASNASWNFTTAASTVTRYVSDLVWTSMTNGWGPVEKDRSNGEAAVW